MRLISCIASSTSALVSCDAICTAASLATSLAASLVLFSTSEISSFNTVTLGWLMYFLHCFSVAGMIVLIVTYRWVCFDVCSNPISTFWALPVGHTKQLSHCITVVVVSPNGPTTVKRSFVITYPSAVSSQRSPLSHPVPPQTSQLFSTLKEVFRVEVAYENQILRKQ